jgi:TolB-like protein
MKPDPSAAAIAVLPFASISGDPENGYFADGLTEEILNKLTHLADATVVARTSSFQFKDVNIDVRRIAGELNASHVLEGSVRHSNISVRVTAQLIEASSGVHLFSETYKHELGSAFTIQDDVASTIALAVKQVIGNQDKPLNAVLVSDRFLAPDDFKRIFDTIHNSNNTHE